MPGARLSLSERAQIEVGWRAGWSIPQIAVAVGRDRSTVWREIRRNNSWRGSRVPDADRYRHPHGRRRNGSGRGGTWPAPYQVVYAAELAHEQARVRAMRPRRRKLVGWHPGSRRRGWDRPVLWDLVEAKLRRAWSPVQISGWLKDTYPDRPEMQVSHETIYQAIYIQARGQLRTDLADRRVLRTGRTARRSQSRAGRVGRGVKAWTREFNISTRPPEVADRAVPGHWEGDLVIGKAGRSAIVTLVERHTRFMMLGALPAGRDSGAVIDVLTSLMGRVPGHLAKTLTWDQGAEMSQHARFTLATDCKVYFADPYKPWLRGTNENTNGLLRQFFPKGVTDFHQYDQNALDEYATLLNERPRQTLGWKTPAHKLNELLVATTN